MKRKIFDLTQPGLLEAGVVVVVQVVETYNPVSPLQADAGDRAAPMKPAAPVTRKVRVTSTLSIPHAPQGEARGSDLFGIRDGPCIKDPCRLAHPTRQRHPIEIPVVLPLGEHQTLHRPPSRHPQRWRPPPNCRFH